MIRTTAEFRTALKSVRRSGTPIVAIRTADPASAMQLFREALNGKAATTPMIQYDIVNGATAMNEPGQAIAFEQTEIPPPDFLRQAIKKLPPESILFFHNPQRLWEQPDILQAIWMTRDTFKMDGRTLVLLSTPGAILPIEIANDVVVLDEPLPSEADLREVAKTLAEGSEVTISDADLDRAVDALVGLAAFPAEQVLAMSMSKSGLDVDALWERKRQVIESTPGLRVWRGGESFDSIGGCASIKKFLRSIMAGKEAPRVIVFVDEIEKAFAGTGTDLSGVTTEMTGTMLGWMQNHHADGVIMVGHPGSGKSAIAKACGASAGIPTIEFDLSAMKSGIVGSSGERLRAALSVIEAISHGRSCWLATCNSISSLPPELRRRFKLSAPFFFDLPDAEERDAIWKIYEKQYETKGKRPKDEGWTGAEIEECCHKAYRLDIPLAEAAAYIVPSCKSASQTIEALRDLASGRFLSASQPGPYSQTSKQVVAVVGKRAMQDIN